MRALLKAIAMLYWGAAVLSAQAPIAHPTAVYTLGVEQQALSPETGSPIRTRFARWAAQCEASPGGAIYVLRCPPALSESRPAQAEDEPEAVTVAVALFRDLDETLYLAGCPQLDELPSEAAADLQPGESTGSEKQDAERERRQARIDCLDLAAGQTFTAEVEGSVMRIVLRGRQAPLTLFGIRPKPKTISSPYEPEPSKVRPSVQAGPLTDSMGIPPASPPRWNPPDLNSVSSSVASAAGGAGVPLARTDLRTGRLVIECGSSPGLVYIDNGFVGLCPIDLPLLAGRHTVLVRSRGSRDWSSEFRISAGESVRLKPGR